MEVGISFKVSVTQADISTQSNDCNLVPITLRTTNRRSHTQKVSRHFVGSIKCKSKKKMCDTLNNLSNRCLTAHTRSLREAFVNPLDASAMHVKGKCLDEHLSSDCRYNLFCLVNTSDNDKLKLAFFFAFIRDKARYQASDRSGTYLNETEHFYAKLIYDDDEYEQRYRQRVGMERERRSVMERTV